MKYVHIYIYIFAKSCYCTSVPLIAEEETTTNIISTQCLCVECCSGTKCKWAEVNLLKLLFSTPLSVPITFHVRNQ